MKTPALLTLSFLSGVYVSLSWAYIGVFFSLKDILTVFHTQVQQALFYTAIYGAGYSVLLVTVGIIYLVMRAQKELST